MMNREQMRKMKRDDEEKVKRAEKNIHQTR